MQLLITSYLLQNKECTLDGIGSLQIETVSARIDSDSKEILPPAEEIIFKDQKTSTDAGLIKYIADKKNISIDEATEIYSNYCKDWKLKIDSGEELLLEPFGAIRKSPDGKIIFESEKLFNFLQPIRVEEIYEAAAINSEKENDINDIISTNTIAEEEVVVERSHWGWWAAILFAIAFAVIFYQLKDKKLNTSSVGNQKNIIVDSASATYQVPK